MNNVLVFFLLEHRGDKVTIRDLSRQFGDEITAQDNQDTIKTTHISQKVKEIVDSTFNRQLVLIEHYSEPCDFIVSVEIIGVRKTETPKLMLEVLSRGLYAHAQIHDFIKDSSMLDSVQHPVGLTFVNMLVPHI